jgi:ABC-type uncharacterized transport system permease subunit
MAQFALYASLFLYAAATAAVFVSLFRPSERLQLAGLLAMIAGFAAHSAWLVFVVIRTSHLPLTNLPESAASIAWAVVVAQLVLFARYRVHAAAFFVYPLVLILLTITATVQSRFVPLDPELRSTLFMAHVLLSALGIAGLLIGLAFTMLYRAQERSLKTKSRGRLSEWIPSLRVCDLLSYRALATGFVIYTMGLLTGILWAYRKTTGTFSLGAKEIGALVAWIMFAALLQSYINGSQRTARVYILSAVAFVSIAVAIFGIQHVSS